MKIQRHAFVPSHSYVEKQVWRWKNITKNLQKKKKTVSLLHNSFLTELWLPTLVRHVRTLFFLYDSSCTGNYVILWYVILEFLFFIFSPTDIGSIEGRECFDRVPNINSNHLTKIVVYRLKQQRIFMKTKTLVTILKGQVEIILCDVMHKSFNLVTLFSLNETICIAWIWKLQ